MEDTELQTPTTELVDNQEVNEDDVNADIEVSSEIDLTDSMESAVDTDLELGEESVPVPESSGVSSEEVAALLNSTLNEYFEQNTIQVVVAGDGIHKPLDELTLSEICLVIIVLILLGRSILHIIGGRAWNRS